MYPAKYPTKHPIYPTKHSTKHPMYLTKHPIIPQNIDTALDYPTMILSNL
jgi:hypothetical protein